MNSNFSFFALIPICLTLIVGCSELNDTSEQADSEEKVVDDIVEVGGSSGDAIPRPPSLTVYVGEETVRPLLGTYSWSVDNGDRTIRTIERDSFAPPELVKGHNSMQVKADTNVELVFKEQPESYTVRILDDSNNVVRSSNKVVLSGKGKIFYDVLAHWEQGTASYAFSLDIE